MRILFPVNEAYPLYKIGGLGDVGGSLPKALKQEGVDVRIILPKHPEIKTPPGNWSITQRFNLTYDHNTLPITIHSGFLPQTNIPVYLIEESTYLSQHTDASDNHADKYAVFSLAVSHWLHQPETHWQPHLIHLHDWHTSLIPVFLTHLYPSTKYRYVLTVHNLAFQGDTDTPVIEKAGIDPQVCQTLQWDSGDHKLNILMEGIIHSDHIVPVSPTYAQEILTNEYGEHLQHILTAKTGAITGILNGLDYDTFNPQADPHIPHHFTAENALEAKNNNKCELQQELGLTEDSQQTLLGFVGRVDGHQKGIDLMIRSLPQLIDETTQLVFLGTGDPNLEQQLHEVADHLPQARVITRFDEPLARRIYAASDLMLIPSQYEPCGLVQLIAMRYGSLPIARATGGLKDTIIHEKTGFLFTNYDHEELVRAVHQAKSMIKNDIVKKEMAHQAMTDLFTWDESAKKYARLYQEIVLK